MARNGGGDDIRDVDYQQPGVNQQKMAVALSTLLLDVTSLLHVSREKGLV
jgi:hypothetical protein